MTAVDVDALDKLREAATAGPWAQHPSDDEYVIGAVVEDEEGPADYLDVADTYAFRKSTGSADAALIVAAVNALEPLLAEVRRGRALREAVEGLAEELAEETANRRRIAGATPCCDAADRLRAVVATVDGGEQ